MFFLHETTGTAAYTPNQRSYRGNFRHRELLLHTAGNHDWTLKLQNLLCSYCYRSRLRGCADGEQREAEAAISTCSALQFATVAG
jgi:hypothetical protein